MAKKNGTRPRRVQPEKIEDGDKLRINAVLEVAVLSKEEQQDGIFLLTAELQGISTTAGPEPHTAPWMVRDKDNVDVVFTIPANSRIAYVGVPRALRSALANLTTDELENLYRDVSKAKRESTNGDVAPETDQVKTNPASTLPKR